MEIGGDTFKNLQLGCKSMLRKIMVAPAFRYVTIPRFSLWISRIQNEIIYQQKWHICDRTFVWGLIPSHPIVGTHGIWL